MTLKHIDKFIEKELRVLRAELASGWNWAEKYGFDLWRITSECQFILMKSGSHSRGASHCRPRIRGSSEDETVFVPTAAHRLIVASGP